MNARGLAAASGKYGGELIVLASFLITFAFIRTSARINRNPDITWWPGSVKTANGLHIHHLIWGVGLTLACGFLTFALEPDGWVNSTLAIGFGIGAGLILDEFALALYLQDVYWTEEGRASLDAVVVAATLAGLVVLGFAPLDFGVGSGWMVAVIAVVDLAAAVVSIAKGKPFAGLVGIFLPPVAFAGAIRLARPKSRWARRFYEPDSAKEQRAIAREVSWNRWREAIHDSIGGAPHLPRRD